MHLNANNTYGGPQQYVPTKHKECVSLPMYICPWANPIKLHI